MKLFVGNINFSIGESELKSRFETFGQVHAIKLVKDRNGKSRGFGFVDMNREPAAIAIAQLDGQRIKGRRLIVKEALPPLREQRNEQDEQRAE